MAIDSARKRQSAMDFDDPGHGLGPLPDATIDAGDRAHLLWLYNGEFIPPTPTDDGMSIRLDYLMQLR